MSLPDTRSLLRNSLQWQLLCGYCDKKLGRVITAADGSDRFRNRVMGKAFSCDCLPTLQHTDRVIATKRRQRLRGRCKVTSAAASRLMPLLSIVGPWVYTHGYALSLLRSLLPTAAVAEGWASMRRAGGEGRGDHSLASFEVALFAACSYSYSMKWYSYSKGRIRVRVPPSAEYEYDIPRFADLSWS